MDRIQRRKATLQLNEPRLDCYFGFAIFEDYQHQCDSSEYTCTGKSIIPAFYWYYYLSISGLLNQLLKEIQ